MRAFLAVFAIVLLAFGASILYYRGDFGLPGKTQTATTSPAQSTETGTPPSNPGSTFDIAQSPNSTTTLGTTSVTYSTISIQQDPVGSVQVGNSVDLKALGKVASSGALLPVSTTWSLADANLGTLSGSQGVSVTFTAAKAGTAKITAKLQNLTATANVTVKSSVLGSSANQSNTPTSGSSTTTTPPAGGPAKPAVTAVEIRLFDTNGSRLNTGDTRTYTAQVFYSDGTLKSTDVNWSVNPGDLGSLNRTKGSSVGFKANRSGNGTLTATLGSLSASLYLQVN